jgi:hypothetical protein
MSVLPALAFAHVVGTTEFVDGGATWCMFGRAAISGESNLDSGTVWSYEEGCTAFRVKDPGKLHTGVELLKKDNNGDFHPCTGWGWQYNTTETYATATLETWCGPHGPCGDGSYKARAHVGLEASGNFHNGTVVSDRHDW